VRARPKESELGVASQAGKSVEGSDEEERDEKDDVGAGAMRSGLTRWSSVPALAVVAGMQMFFLRCLFAS
jgi:hypothetical protein